MTKKKPAVFSGDFPSLKAVDKSLYCLLQVAYELKLMSERAFHYATTCPTNLSALSDDDETR